MVMNVLILFIVVTRCTVLDEGIVLMVVGYICVVYFCLSVISDRQEEVRDGWRSRRFDNGILLGLDVRVWIK